MLFLADSDDDMSSREIRGCSAPYPLPRMTWTRVYRHPRRTNARDSRAVLVA